MAGSATSMGVTHTRVKGVVSAMVALGGEAAAAPAATAPRAVSVVRPEPVPARDDTADSAADDSGIDIEALLALRRPARARHAGALAGACAGGRRARTRRGDTPRRRLRA